MNDSPLSPKILAAAARLLATRGPQGFTMDDLARAAHVSRATLYRQAGSREDVLDALSAAGTPVGDRTETRARILAAARTVFGRVGFDSATVDEIAREADVGLATVYRHFGDKDGLVAAFIDEFSPRRAAREISAAPTGDLRRDLEHVATRILATARDDTSLVRLMLLETLWGGATLPRVRALSPTRTLNSIATLLRAHAGKHRFRVADTQVLARNFSGMILAAGVLGPLMRSPSIDDPAEAARLVTDLFLNGALARKGPA